MITKPVIRLALSLVLIASVSAGGQPVDERAHEEALRHYRLGQDYYYQEQFEKAVAEYTRAIELNPLLTLAHYGLGQSYMNLKQYPSAVRAFVACRTAFHDLAALAQGNQAEVDRMREDEERELKDAIRRLRSGQIKVLNAENQIVRIESRLRELERSRQAGAEVVDTPAEVSMALGSAYFRTGELEGAEREYREAIRVNPKFGEAFNNLAVVYLMTGRPREAQGAIDSAEGSGFRVPPGLKKDVEQALRPPL